MSSPRSASAWVLLARSSPVLVTMLALGCASAPLRREGVGITLDALLAGVPPGEAEPSALVADAQVLAVSPGMQDFLSEHVAHGADRVTRLRQLVSAIISGGSFRLQYDERTRTAAGTFQARKGNCLSFSSMFVALARQAGLSASYQEVDVPPDWSLDNETFVLNRHVNVLLDLGKEGEHVVDFNMDDFRTSYDRRAISDARALAHFYNNLAVEQMQAGDAVSALQYFRRAVGHDARFSPAWTNLGILYWRKGRADYAEAAYLQALQADGRDLVAMSNLASLYERGGDQERAALFRSRVRDHRQRNPYYRFQLARQAFLAEDYEQAIGHLEYAIRQRKNEDQFYSLLGLAYMKKGDERAARRWLARAEEVAATDALKRRYANKLDNLLSAAPRSK
jgi:Flp pilus assembly protein TadD